MYRVPVQVGDGRIRPKPGWAYGDPPGRRLVAGRERSGDHFRLADPLGLSALGVLR
jgi:hypothetical protein